MWVSKHGLKGNNLQNLQLIVEYIVGVYYPCWFRIKVKHSWVEGPHHILFQLRMLRSQNKIVTEAVMKTVKRSAWYAHSECILQTLLSSENEEERRDAIKKIVEVRGAGDDMIQTGDSNVRPRKTPDINSEAKKLTELINRLERQYL